MMVSDLKHIEEQIAELRIPVKYGPAATQQARDKAADTMQAMLDVVREAQKAYEKHAGQSAQMMLLRNKLDKLKATETDDG